MGHSNVQQTFEYVYADVEGQRTAFMNGNGETPPSIVPTPAPSPKGKLDGAIAALTTAYSRGDLSTEAFAAAVAALSSGSF